MIGLIDNFDSFTYNLVALFESVGENVIVFNQTTPLETCLAANVDAWILGPGPKGPCDTGVCAQLIGHAPILGVCLGHQLIAHHFGGTVVQGRPHHGVTSAISHNNDPLFKNIPQFFYAARYHSLVVDQLPKELEAIAWSIDGVIMGLKHRSYPIWGVQFHPDSVASEFSKQLALNFITEILRPSSLLEQVGY